jgi:hypothetical protein
MIKHLSIALGAATLSFIPTLAHAEEGTSGQPPVDVAVYPPGVVPPPPDIVPPPPEVVPPPPEVVPPPPEVGVQPPTVSPGGQPSTANPVSGSLPVSGSDSTTMLLQIGSLLLAAGGLAVVATHRRRGATAPA